LIFILQKNKKDKKLNQWYLKHMTRDITQFAELKLKAEGYATYGANNRGRILKPRGQ